MVFAHGLVGLFAGSGGPHQQQQQQQQNDFFPSLLDQDLDSLILNTVGSQPQQQQHLQPLQPAQTYQRGDPGDGGSRVWPSPADIYFSRSIVLEESEPKTGRDLSFNCLKELPALLRSQRGWWAASVWFVYFRRRKLETVKKKKDGQPAASAGGKKRKALLGDPEQGGKAKRTMELMEEKEAEDRKAAALAKSVEPGLFYVYCRQIRVAGQFHILRPLAVVDVNKKGGLRMINARPDGQHLLNDNALDGVGAEPTQLEFFLGDAQGMPFVSNVWDCQLGVHLVKLKPPQSGVLWQF